MLKRDFILKAFKETDIYYYADWIFTLLTIIPDNGPDNYPNPELYRIATVGNKYVYFNGTEWAPFTDSPNAQEEPLFLPSDEITINSQDEIIQPFDKFPFTTKVGNVVLNYYCLVSSFGNRFPFQVGKMSIGKLEKMVASKLVDYEPGKPKDPTKVYPDEVKLFSSACQSVAGFSSIYNPGATAYTMVPPPGLKEFRAQLLEKYKDHLNDPAYIAMIDKELVAYDKAFQAQDPDGGFYISEKAFNVSRKKLFLMQGYTQPEVSGGRSGVLKTSLSEGWQIEDMPLMIDELRDGSYNRGALTALGGEAVKFIFRIFAATQIAEEDCGSKVGMPRDFSKDDISNFLGNTIILPNGKQVKLDNTNMKQYVGQKVMVRSPGFCLTKDSNFCMTCLGEQLRDSKNSLAALASEIGSDMLYIFMKKMHGTQLATTLWKYEETIS